MIESEIITVSVAGQGRNEREFMVEDYMLSCC